MSKATISVLIAVAMMSIPLTAQMTVTGTIGGLCFAAWAAGDHIWLAGRRATLRE